jgi:hypothetical protein
MPARMEMRPSCVNNINDLVQPFETGWFVPPDPEKSAESLPKDW